MGRGRSKFKQTDVVRAVKAIRAAGEKVARVEFTDEKIIVVTADGASLAPKIEDNDEAEFQQWLKEQHDDTDKA